MSLSDRLATPPEVFPVRCAVARTLEQLDGPDLAAFNAALDDTRWTSEALARALIEEGHNLRGESVARHRRGACRCGTRR